MFDFEIAKYLYRVAFLYENVIDSPYKYRAYYKAALSVDGYSKHIEELCYSGSIKDLPHIGVSISKNIDYILKYGTLPLIEELLGDLPESIFEFYEYSNIGKHLFKKLIANKIYSITALSSVLQHQQGLFSPHDLSILSSTISEYRNKKFQYAQVFEIGKELQDELLSANLVIKSEFVGSVYAKEDSMPFGEIICIPKVSTDSIKHFIDNAHLYATSSVTSDCINLQRFDITLKLYMSSQRSYKYRKDKLNVAYTPPRVKPEIKGTFKKIYGDLHMHTDWSDGLHSIEQMREYATELEYNYIAITDHSQSLKPSGMSELDTLSQIKKIREINLTKGIHVLSGIEVDILADGSLDLPDSILREFDIVIASVHSHFNQGLLTTERLVKAIRNPYVNVLGHPMGRLLGKPGRPTITREEMQIDFDYLLQACKENNVALEMNSFPERFDLSLNNVIRAVNAGVKISVGTDAHSMYHLDCAKYAIEFFKSAGVPSTAVINCLKYNDLMLLLKKGRIDESKKTAEFITQFKDFRHYFSNNIEIYNGIKKVVGIDLTGSEGKASGFAVLSGTTAHTQSIYTDDEMIKEIIKINPAVVSIDSPLSLPKGRCCSNKDCECAKYGIMRYCELLLRHFNIGVYPCLIDSMVNLTMRGIKTAERLNELGIKVIESYPGVAQDLLHIPRKKSKKGTGFEPLINGLKNFGIEGIREDSTHDEIDAITSALVGQFYLADKFVAIGREEENYLIVPRLESSLSGQNIVIGLVGKIASGKTTIAEYMRFKYGFDSMRYSKVISDLYSVSGRDELQRVGEEIAADKKKQAELTEYIISKMKPGRNYVIDGIRQNEDYYNLSSNLGERFTMIAIEASTKNRAKRYIKNDPKTTEEKFLEVDTKPVEKSIPLLELKCQHQILNNSGYITLREQIDGLITSFSK